MSPTFSESANCASNCDAFAIDTRHVRDAFAEITGLTIASDQLRSASKPRRAGVSPFDSQMVGTTATPAFLRSWRYVLFMLQRSTGGGFQRGALSASSESIHSRNSAARS